MKFFEKLANALTREGSKWEQIDKATDRLKVPGGWIVRSISSRYSDHSSIHQVFIQDQAHEWKIEDLENVKEN